MENNKTVAGLLRQIAVLLEEQGVDFKPAAYRRAAKTIEDLPMDVSTFKTAKELMELSGIGEAIAGKIREYLETGHVHVLDGLLATQGGISPELMNVDDLGPRRARQFQKELGITTVAELIKAAEEGKLRSLPRMSELLETKILENAKRVKERTRRFPRAEVTNDVEAVLQTLQKVSGVEKAAVAGSYRREKETVGDIDILAVAKNIEKVSEAMSKLPIVSRVVAHGGTKLSFDLKSGLRVDVRLVHPDQWGAALLYFTGDKEHNIALRKLAIQRGWKLNEYGLFEGEKILASRTEEEIYKTLGLRWIEPGERNGAISMERSAVSG